MLINRRFYVGNSQSILVQTGVNETMSESCLITELRRRVLPHFLPIDCYNHEFEALSKVLSVILDISKLDSYSSKLGCIALNFI